MKRCVLIEIYKKYKNIQMLSLFKLKILIDILEIA